MASTEDERTLFVSNLTKEVSEELLYELFLQAGPVERVKIPVSSSHKKYGFVTYKHKCSIDYAIDLYKGVRLFNMDITIKKKQAESQSKQTGAYNQDNYQSRPSYQSFNDDTISNAALRGLWSGHHNRPQPYDRDRRDRNRRYQDHGRRNYNRHYERRENSYR